MAENIDRRHSIALLAATGLSMGLGAPAFAQTYPSKPIRMIVPFAAGGPLDIVARAIADKMSVSMKQPFVLEAKPGAGGNIGTELVAKAAPDGYTLLLVLGTTLTVNPSLYNNLSFNPQRDLQPISIVTTASQMLVVHPSVPVNTLAEFVAWAKKEGPVSYGHAGYGSPAHLVMEYFRLRAGFRTVPVPYRGSAPLVTDLIGGQLKVAFGATVGVMPHVHAGRLKGLAISTSTRSPLAPDVPTVAESGYPGFRLETNFILLAPAGTPAAIVARLEREVRDALKSPDLQASFRAQDFQIVGSTAEEAGTRIKADTELWAGIVKDADMHVQ